MDGRAEARHRADLRLAGRVKADGTGGVTLNEVEDVAVIYAETLAYTEFMEFTFTPVLAINDAVGPILAELAKG